MQIIKSIMHRRFFVFCIAMIVGQWPIPALADHGGSSHINVNLTVPATSSTGNYTVTWTALTNNVLQQKINSGSYTNVYVGSGGSWSATNQANGTYTYRIKWTFCYYGCATYYSAPASIVVSVGPGTPTGLTGPATDYNGSYTISWNAASGATSYNLQEATNGGAWSQIYSGAAISKAVSGKAAGSYGYRVQACAGASNCSGWSATHTTTVQAPPATPTELTGPAYDADGSYTISWNASTNSTSYRLEEQLGAGAWTQVYSGSGLSKAIAGNVPGIYTYRVKGCNVESVCSSWSTTHVVDVNSGTAAPGAPPAPSTNLDPGQGSTTETDTIGTTAGSFRVDESGAATYTVPIALAAGTAGVAPEVALEYSSNSGNGIAGYGWAIGGLSSINRCRQTVDQDKNVEALAWSTSDRFCLDGQRLVLESGSPYGYGDVGAVYRTELDSGSIVTAVGGTAGKPDYFDVKRKDGSTSYYGESPSDPSNQSAKLVTGAGDVLTWGIRHFQDSVGNSIWFDYVSSGGAQRISKIMYAYGSAMGPAGYNAYVDFTYEARPDVISGYVAGALFKNDQRLARIKSYNTVTTSTLIREYVLTYQPASTVTYDTISRLASIQECVGVTCLPPTDLTWRVPVNSPSVVQIATANFSGSFAGFTPADINGDGRMDLAWLEGSGATKTLKYAFSTGASYVNQTFSSGSLSLSVGSSTTSPFIRAIDYNLDGRQDIAWWDEASGVWKLVIAEPYGNNQWRLQSAIIPTPVPARWATFADVDSNGTTDAIYKIEGSGDNKMYLRRLEPQGVATSSSTFYAFGPAILIAGSGNNNTIGQITALAGDFNGDGQVDVAMGGQEEQCDEDGRNCITVRNFRALTLDNTGIGGLTISSYHSFGPVWVESLQQLHYPKMDKLQAADINGDGLSDAFYPVGPFFSSDPSQYALQINKGDGTFEYFAITDASLTNTDANPQLIDWNMDGHADLVWKDKSGTGSVKARHWNPGLQTSGMLDTTVYTVTSSITTNVNESASYADVNGDAAPDIIKINAGGTIGSVQVMTRKVGSAVANVAANRIETITNGLGASTQVTYEPLSYTDHYERLEVAPSPATETICKNLGHPSEEVCWEEYTEAANATDFYDRLNGDWELPSGAQTLGKNSPVIELSGPMYVVTDVVGDAPSGGALPGAVNTAATSSISYYYGEAKLQAAGRGFLGFQRLKTVDNQSNVKTITRYRQDWPFTGRPIFTEVLSPAGHTLQKTTTDWEVIEWSVSTPTTAASAGTAALGQLHVVQSYSGEQTFDLVSNGATQGPLLKTLSTENAYDLEGNATSIKVKTRKADGTEVKVVDTTNRYFCLSTAGNPTCIPSGTFESFEGRLAEVDVTTTYYGSAPQLRQSSFEYYSTGAPRGLLWKEIVEPNQSAYTVTTTHSYDARGNRVRSAVTGGAETRCNVDTSVYDNTGRYVVSTFDCLGHKLTTALARNAYGSPTSIASYVDVNGVDHYLTSISYSVLGREYYRYTADGSQGSSYLSSDLTYCPASTAFRATSSNATGGASSECFDVLGRSVRKMTRGFDGAWDAVDIEYDAKGNVLRQSEPFDLISGNQIAPYWTTFGRDLLDRVTSTALPDGSSGTTTYAGLATTVTNDLSQSRTEEVNELGEVIRVTDNLNGVTSFTYDHQGNMKSMTDPSGLNVTTMVYDLLGRKIAMNDPDKGSWSYVYNAFGELTLQTDAKGQSQITDYDGLGRMISRMSKFANGSVEGNTTWTYDTAAHGLGQLASVLDSQAGYMRSMLFDGLGRADEVVTNFDGGIYYEKTTFDQFGRPYQVFDAAGDGSFQDQGILNEYNANGYLERVSDAVLVAAVPRTTYRKIVSMNARGQVTGEHKGIDNLAPSPTASVISTYTYSPATGRLTDIDSLNSVTDVQDLHYNWDTVGNLTSRDENSGSKSLHESFGYDGLNRLTTQTVTGQGTVTVAYNSIGNITSKSDVGSYGYPGAGTARPHAVSNVGGSTYAYDANGNNTSGGGRVIQYTTFDKPYEITKGTHKTELAYGPDRARYRRIDTGSGVTVTRYVGNVEIIVHPNGNQDRKRYLAGVAVETLHFGTDTVLDSRETHYVHQDHLGSVDVITDAAGAIVQEQSFDAWGRRRDATDWSAYSAAELTGFNHSLTTRGFTGHEMLDETGIVHMNGRIYDPALGRFLQADPIVQDPLKSASLNRYSYAWNNPLNATDPSGYFLFSLIIAAALHEAALGTFIEFALFAFGGMADALASGAHLGDALVAGLSAGAFSFAGGKFADTGVGFGKNWETAAYVASVGTIGGVTSILQGGKFGDGFKSAGVGTVLGGVAGRVSAHYGDLGRGIAMTVAAGTASAITGGKFANGAITAAFVITAGELLQSGEGQWDVEQEGTESNRRDTFEKALHLVAEGEENIRYIDVYAGAELSPNTGATTYEFFTDFGSFEEWLYAKPDARGVISGLEGRRTGGFSFFGIKFFEAREILIYRTAVLGFTGTIAGIEGPVTLSPVDNAMHVIGHELGHRNGIDTMPGPHPNANRYGINLCQAAGGCGVNE